MHKKCISVLIFFHPSSFILHHFKELAKNIMRVVRTRRGFRVELHAGDRLVLHSQTFKRVIVQAFVGDFHFVFIQVAFGDAVIMVLRGDENLSAWQVLNGMIPAVMTKLEAVGIRTERAPDELMTEANAKHWHAAFD